ncbi:MAG: TetR/AcrR family transcriptional regulator [Candidatus Shapirobacteria bacterium]|nr:TetR/AcrR family transcriptional regulator [Candidatus Shapirobacteria bacterium]
MSTKNKKEKIISAAISEFARDGFEKASIDAIALKAKVAKGTVFYHFKSKNELFEEIVTEAYKKLEKIVEKKIENLKTEREKIEKIIEIEVDFIHKYRDLFSVYLSDTIKKITSFKIIDGVLKVGIQKGEFRKDLDTNTASVALFWLTAMTCLNCKNVKTKEIQDLVLKGVLK